MNELNWDKMVSADSGSLEVCSRQLCPWHTGSCGSQCDTGAGFDTTPPRATPINNRPLGLRSQLNQTLAHLKLSVYKTNLRKSLIPPETRQIVMAA